MRRSTTGSTVFRTFFQAGDEAILTDGRQRIRSTAAICRDFARHFAQRYRTDGCQTRAAALTYVTLFAVVPLLTLSFSAFALIPALGASGTRIRQLLLDLLIPVQNPEVAGYLIDFAQRARSLSAIGGLALVVTALLTLRAIERTFNHIWGVPDYRRGLADFLRYWAVLTLGPVLLGTGLALHTYLVALRALLDGVDVFGITRLVLVYLPALLSWLAFTLLFATVPHAQVPLRRAAVGGLVTAVLLHTARLVFGAIVTNSNYHTIYGAFAALPLFLLWIYLCWLIVLGGAELVRALETFADARGGQGPSDLIALLLATELCVRARRSGATVADRDVLRAGLTESQWQRLRPLLLDHHILAMTVNGGHVLARDPAQIPTAQLAALVPEDILGAQPRTLPPQCPSRSWFSRVERLRCAARDRAREALDLSIEELFEATGEPDPHHDSSLSHA